MCFIPFIPQNFTNDYIFHLNFLNECHLMPYNIVIFHIVDVHKLVKKNIANLNSLNTSSWKKKRDKMALDDVTEKTASANSSGAFAKCQTISNEIF